MRRHGFSWLSHPLLLYVARTYSFFAWCVRAVGTPVWGKKLLFGTGRCFFFC